jgi:aerobic-type carbon monoxide dehydrogenase small subunit (CoxS/CutS family)
MPLIRFTVNGCDREVDIADTSTPLLWVLRDQLGLTGTKYGCGIAQCGSCTVHIDGRAERSCSVPISSVAGRQVVTIEGLEAADGRLHPVQEAWIESDVAQCGYCQPGQIMQAVALLNKHAEPTEAEVDEAMSGVLCRCGTYARIRAAIRGAAEKMKTSGGAA